MKGNLQSIIIDWIMRHFSGEQLKAMWYENWEGGEPIEVQQAIDEALLHEKCKRERLNTNAPWQRICCAAPIRRSAMKLEPVLDARAQNWDAGKRREVANVFRRWAAQLEHSAAVMELVAGAPVEGAAPAPQPLRCDASTQPRNRLSR